MNVYNCCYKGTYGYGVRTRGKSWLFVPELAQPINDIKKNLSLHDLTFRNTHDQFYEMNQEAAAAEFSLSKMLKSIFCPAYKPLTIGGLLFIVK